MIRIPVTLADLQGARYKSSLAKFKKYSTPYSGIEKLTALREAFAKALGYGTEAELRFVAKRLGDRYTDAPLPIAHAIASVSQRIARQWSVTAEFADIVASSLGLEHFDACRATPRVYPRKPDWSNAFQALIQVQPLVPADLQTSPDDHSGSDAAPQTVPSNTIQAEPDRMHADANLAQAVIDQFMKANPAQAAIIQFMKSNLAQAAIDQFMKVNPAQAAIDQFMKSNPAQAAIDQFMKSNPAQAAIDQFMKVNPAQAAIDQFMKSNPAQAAIDQFMKSNPTQAALDQFMKANLRIAERWSREVDDAEDEH